MGQVLLAGVLLGLSTSPTLAQKAPVSPLFASDSLLVLTVEADFRTLLKDRDPDGSPYHEAMLTFTAADGQEVSIDAKLKTRGNFRLKLCDFPPLKLNLPKKAVKGTVFDGHDKLKMVTHCNNKRSVFEQYVLQEYLIYKTYNLFTDISFRVRLAQITYVDTSGKHDPRTHFAFFIEEDEHLADRHGGVISDVVGLPQTFMNPETMQLVSVFQFFIGNTDWVVSALHNIKLLYRDAAKKPHPIPYDFDWTGVVQARYAQPKPEYGLRSVRDRLYMGHCQHERDFTKTFALFKEKKEAVYALYQSFPYLTDKQRRRTLNYYDDFYDVINNKGDIRASFILDCRTWD